MEPIYLLGIDLGTTTCRAAIFDGSGREIAAAYREIAVRYPCPLWAEVEPEAWWHGVAAVTRDALAASGLPSRAIASVGLSGLMHAPVLLDAVGQPVAPAMLWMDQRCASQCARLRAEAAARGRDPVGLTTGQSAPKLRWLAETQPAVLSRARVVLLPKDFIRFRLTGALATDPSDAGGTGLFDRERGDWDRSLAELCGIGADLLPPIVPSAARAGAVTDAAARETGLVAGTPVAVGGADTLCARLGAGALDRRTLCLYLGTAAWFSLIDGRAPDGQPVVRAFGATATTGAALRWTRDLLDPDDRRTISDRYAALVQLAEEAPPGAEGLFFLPHLMGERGPHPVPLARGAFIGLTLRHGRAHLARAVLEGTAFQIRRLFEARLAPDRPGAAEAPAVACGGAARSAAWMQILADVTGRAFRIPEIVEASALGAAMLGGTAAGCLTLETASARMVRYIREVWPDPDRRARYEPLYHRYCRLDDLLMTWFDEGG